MGIDISRNMSQQHTVLNKQNCCAKQRLSELNFVAHINSCSNSPTSLSSSSRPLRGGEKKTVLIFRLLI